MGFLAGGTSKSLKLARFMRAASGRETPVLELRPGGTCAPPCSSPQTQEQQEGIWLQTSCPWCQDSVFLSFEQRFLLEEKKEQDKEDAHLETASQLQGLGAEPHSYMPSPEK
jgi:hypothetical protein